MLTFYQCPGVGLCHQEWYLSLVQNIRRHVEHNKEQDCGGLQTVNNNKLELGTLERNRVVYEGCRDKSKNVCVTEER